MSAYRSAGSAMVAVAVAVLLSACLPLPLPFIGPGSASEPVDEGEARLLGECPWVPAAGEVPIADPAADPVAATEAVALDEDSFWLLVESIPSRPTAADFDRVSIALAACSMSDIVGFEARMALALYALDGPENHEWYVANDPGPGLRE